MRLTHIVSDISLNQNLVLPLRRLADGRSRSKLVGKELGGLLHVDVEVVQAVYGRDVLLLAAFHPLHDDLGGL